MSSLSGNNGHRGSPAHDGQTRAGLFTDVHCHCLPGLDDGPADREDAIRLCRALVDDGVSTVVATPHQLGRFDGAYDAAHIRQAVIELNQALLGLGIALHVLPGADVRLDERIPELLASDRILTVADRRRHLLLELPHEVFIDPSTLLARLRQLGIQTVITHPERHGILARKPGYVQLWREYGTCLQITAASLTGRFGRVSQDAAWAFIRQPLPVLVAGDAHDVGSRAPQMTGAYRLLAERFGAPAARMLCIENPAKVASGDELPVPAAAAAGREVRR